jgi:hypothetical protein
VCLNKCEPSKTLPLFAHAASGKDTQFMQLGHGTKVSWARIRLSVVSCREKMPLKQSHVLHFDKRSCVRLPCFCLWDNDSNPIAPPWNSTKKRGRYKNGLTLVYVGEVDVVLFDAFDDHNGSWYYLRLVIIRRWMGPNCRFVGELGRLGCSFFF